MWSSLLSTVTSVRLAHFTSNLKATIPTESSLLIFRALEYINKNQHQWNFKKKKKIWHSIPTVCTHALLHACGPGLRCCRGLTHRGCLQYTCTRATACLICRWKTSRAVPRNRASLVFSLSCKSMHLHWYGMAVPIDPLCLVFVLAHYGDEGVTFCRGVRVERRLFSGFWKNV